MESYYQVCINIAFTKFSEIQIMTILSNESRGKTNAKDFWEYIDLPVNPGISTVPVIQENDPENGN